MAPERDLDRLLGLVAPQRHDGVYVFCEVPAGRVPQDTEPLMVFSEGETATIVLTEERAAAAGLVGEAPSAWITLGANSDLAAIGFLAVITGRLSARGISVNVVSGYRHDHLFVPVAMAEEAMATLSGLEATHPPVEEPGETSAGS